MAHNRHRSYDEMKAAHRDRLVAYMQNLDRMHPEAWSIDFASLRKFVHAVGADAFLEPILFDLKCEDLITYEFPLARGAQIYLRPTWRKEC